MQYRYQRHKFDCPFYIDYIQEEQWNLIFKRKNTAKENSSKKARRTQNDPHICLLCGKILARGTPSYKTRHWQQNHPTENQEICEKSIVQQDHIKAKQLLAQHEKTKLPHNSKESAVGLQEDLTSNSNSSDTADDLQTPSSDNTEAGTSSARTTVQSTLSGFFQTSATEEDKETHSSLSKLQDSVNEILVKLDELTLEASKKKCVGHEKVTISLDDINESNNLLDLITSNKVDIQLLDDGCKITCTACKEYIKENPYMKM